MIEIDDSYFCSNCGVVIVAGRKSGRGRCPACYSYLRLHGVDRVFDHQLFDHQPAIFGRCDCGNDAVCALAAQIGTFSRAMLIPLCADCLELERKFSIKRPFVVTENGRLGEADYGWHSDRS